MFFTFPLKTDFILESGNTIQMPREKLQLQTARRWQDVLLLKNTKTKFCITLEIISHDLHLGNHRLKKTSHLFLQKKYVKLREKESPLTLVIFIHRDENLFSYSEIVSLGLQNSFKQIHFFFFSDYQNRRNYFAG